MSKKYRKSPTLKDRMTPCVVCLHPLSQRHHLLSFSVHGEKGVGTIQLCANCHDLYHFFERYAHRKQSENGSRLFEMETQEEKLIETIGNRLEYRPLVRLASIVTVFNTMVSRKEDFSSSSEEDRDRVLDCLNFIANFKRYVEGERKKQDDWFKANIPLITHLFDGGHIERTSYE